MKEIDYRPLWVSLLAQTLAIKDDALRAAISSDTMEALAKKQGFVLACDQIAETARQLLLKATRDAHGLTDDEEDDDNDEDEETLNG